MVWFGQHSLGTSLQPDTTMKHNRILPLVLAALAITAGCKKDEAYPADTAAPASATPATDTKSFDVGDIDMGRHISADKKISDKTDDFAPKDTIYASIHTKGGSAPTQLTARWTFQDSTDHEGNPPEGQATESAAPPVEPPGATAHRLLDHNR